MNYLQNLCNNLTKRSIFRFILTLLALTASQKVPCDGTKDILEENPTKMAGNRERTFIMLKPDAVQRGLVGEIIKRFEQKGFKLVAMKMMTVIFKIFYCH